MQAVENINDSGAVLSDNIKVILAVTTTITLWASAFVGIRFGLHDYSPGTLALLRYLTASLIMGFIYFNLPERQKVEIREIPRLILMGVCGIGIYNIALNYGEISVSAGIASFIIGLMPVFAIVLAIVFLGERISLRSWGGVIISLLGTLMIAYSEFENMQYDIGILEVLIAGLGGSIFINIQKPLLKKYKPLELTTFSIWAGTLLMLFFAPDLLSTMKQASTQSTMAVVYMGVFPACIAYTTWAYALSKIPVTKAVTALYAMPLATCILGFIVLHEIPTLLAFLGGIVAIVGAFIVNYFSK